MVEPGAPDNFHPSKPPCITWDSCPEFVYFVNWAPFSLPDVYIVIAGPLVSIETSMIWQTEEDGLYTVGAEAHP